MSPAHFRVFTLIAALALSSTAVSQATAQILAGGGGTLRTDGGKVVGISLNSFGQTITSLGFYDHNQDGINASYQLGLWDAGQMLLATATVTPSSPLTGDFRYAAISPVTIGTFQNPQSFTIGVLLPQSLLDPWQDNATIIPFAGFTGAGTGQFSAPTNSLVYPSSLDTSNYYVVNANGPAPAVPEPTSAIGLAIAAICGLGTGTRGRRKLTSNRTTQPQAQRAQIPLVTNAGDCCVSA